MSKKTVKDNLPALKVTKNVTSGNKKVGRPSKLNLETMKEVILELARNGASDTAIAVKLGIARETLYSYCKTNTKFNNIIKEAKTLSEGYWENLMHSNILLEKDKPRVDTIAWIFNMKNRFGWKDKTELSSDKDNPLTINLDVKASKV